MVWLWSAIKIIMFELEIPWGSRSFLASTQQLWGHAHDDAHWYAQKSHGILISYLLSVPNLNFKIRWPEGTQNLETPYCQSHWFELWAHSNTFSNTSRRPTVCTKRSVLLSMWKWITHTELKFTHYGNFVQANSKMADRTASQLELVLRVKVSVKVFEPRTTWSYRTLPKLL